MRRKIVADDQCAICCLLAGATVDACELLDREDLTGAYVAGYLAGRHVVAKGESAEERVCAAHAKLLDAAVARYTKRGMR